MSGAEDVRRSARASKAPDAFTYEAREIAPIEVAGQGTPLADMEPVVERLKKTTARDPALKQIHTIMYSRVVSQKEVKANILKFNGFPADAAAADGFQERLTGKMHKYSLANIKTIFDILCVNRSGPSFDGAQPSKEQLIDRLAGWLVAPTADLVVALKAKTKRGAVKAAKAATTSAKKKKQQKRKAAKTGGGAKKKKAAAVASESEGEEEPEPEPEPEPESEESEDTKRLRAAVSKALEGKSLSDTPLKEIRKAVEQATGFDLKKERKAEFMTVLTSLL